MSHESILNTPLGDCEYVLAEDHCGDGNGTFRVTVENVPCGAGAVTCTKSARVQILDTTIHIVRGLDPTVTKDESFEPKAVYLIDVSGIYLFIKTPYGELCVFK